MIDRRANGSVFRRRRGRHRGAERSTADFGRLAMELARAWARRDGRSRPHRAAPIAMRQRFRRARGLSFLADRAATAEQNAALRCDRVPRPDGYAQRLPLIVTAFLHTHLTLR